MEYVGTRLLQRMMKFNIGSRRRFEEKDTGLRVVLVGTGSPLPDPTRGGPCTVVIAGGEYLIVDVGQGSWASQNAKLRDMNPNGVTGIFLTHFHSDHITVCIFEFRHLIKSHAHTHEHRNLGRL